MSKLPVRQREIRISIASLYAIMGQPMAYQPDFARMLKSVPAAVLLSYLTNWIGKGNDPDGWVYKTQDEIEANTGLSKGAQRRARAKLINDEILLEKRQGLPSKMFYNIDMEALLKKLHCVTSVSDTLSSTRSNTMLLSTMQENTSEKNKQEKGIDFFPSSETHEPVRIDNGLAEVVKEFERDIGVLSMSLRDEIIDAIAHYGSENVKQAIKVAALNPEIRQGSKWKYAGGVLRNMDKDAPPRKQENEVVAQEFDPDLGVMMDIWKFGNKRTPTPLQQQTLSQE